VRAYLMFCGPWEQGGDWNDSGIAGVNRWIRRVWNLVLEELPEPEASGEDTRRELLRVTHRTIKKVTEDMEQLQFNTMIAALMEYTNYLAKMKEEQKIYPEEWREIRDTLIKMLAPTAPHTTEELWYLTGHTGSVHNQQWPTWDEALTIEEEITLVVQVNGKLRGRIMVPASLTEEEALKTALNNDKIKSVIAGKTVAKTIYVPGKLINLVVK